MKLFKQLRFTHVFALAVVMSVAVACDDDGTGLENDETDPVQTASAMQNVNEALGSNEGLESYRQLSPLFTSIFAPAPAIVPNVPGFQSVPAGMEVIAANSMALLERERLGVTGPVIPDQYLGMTFEYDPQTQQYAPSSRTGAPADGVRFILYLVNPVTGEPDVENEIGHVDLRDTSDQTANRLVTTVVVDGATLIDYTSTCSLTQSSISVASVGFVSDGTTVVNFDLSFSFSEFSGLTIDFSVDIPSANIEVNFFATATNFDTAGDDLFAGDFQMDFDISRGTNAIVFTLAGDANGSISGQVEICGGADGEDCTVVAVIAGTFDAPIITDAGGNDLGTDGIQGLGDLFEAAGDFVGNFFEFLAPAFALCFTLF